MLQVLGRIDQRASPLVLGLGADDHVIDVTPRNADDLGISLVLRIVGIGAEQRKRIFLRPAVISQPCKTGVGVPRPVRIAMVARVVEVYFVIDGHGGTGIDAFVVIAVLLVGQKTDAKVLPGHQILGDDVIPMLQAVDRAPGTPLIEKMPAVVVPHKPVRIVHQAGDCLIVKGLPVNRSADPVIQLLKFLRILQIAILLFFSPYSHVLYLP